MTTRGLPTWPWTQSEAEDLPRPEALLLEALRRWAGAAAAGQPALPALRLPLVAESAGAIAPSLDALMRAGGGGFRFAPLVESQLTPDEAALLLALALAQRATRREALAALLRLLPPAEACAALAAGIQAGHGLRRAGLLLCKPWP